MGLFKADLFHASVPGMWHCKMRAGAVAPVCVYTSDSKGSNGQVKMRQLTLPGREQPIHRPEGVMSNGGVCSGHEWHGVVSSIQVLPERYAQKFSPHDC